jgi:thioesterase domain-containing protein
MLTHRGRDNRVTHENAVYQMTQDDRHILKSSISFTLLTREVFWPLLTGATMFITPPGTEQDSAYLVKFLAANKITIVTLTPSMLGAFLEEPEVKNCVGLRHVVCFGEILTPALQRRFFSRLSAELSMFYGATEAPSATLLQCRREDVPTTVQLGHPLPGKEVHLLDRELQPVPFGIAGELYIGGKVARGYFQRPDLTAERFIPDPFTLEHGARLYRTGDLGRYLPDGSIEFVGRTDDQVKIRGFRIELGEIEARLREHAAIRQAIVIVREDRATGRGLDAYVILEVGKVSNAGELREYLRTRLPDYMIPREFVFLDALPLTPNGKVDRKALPAPDRNRSELEASYVAPRDALEVQLTRIWEKVLGRTPIGGRDNFFELGGHSLLAVQVIHQIREVFGQTLPVKALFQAPSVEQLAEVLREEDPLRDWASLVPLQPRGSKPPFFFLAGRSHFGGRLGPDQPVYRVVYQDLDREQPFVRIEDMAAHSIESVRKIQPNGPYYLGGHAVGGVVAFEMAQQLRQHGQKVALLALCECWAPQSRRPTSRTLLSYRLWQKASYHFRRVRRVGTKQALTDFVGTLKKKTQGAAGFKQRVSLTPAEKEAKAAVLEATGHYVPEVYTGRIVLIRCSERGMWRDYDPLDGWGSLATNGVEMYEVPGEHASIYREPYVGMLTEILRDVLHGAQAEMGNERTSLAEENESLRVSRSLGGSQGSRKDNKNPRHDSQSIWESLPGR